MHTHRSFRFTYVVRTGLLMVLPQDFSSAATPEWSAPQSYRLLLHVDSRGVTRSHSPASVEIDFTKALSAQNAPGVFDQHSIEVVAQDNSGKPRIYNGKRNAQDAHLIPWRLEKFYGISKSTLHFVLPDEKASTYAVYFDTKESGHDRPKRYPGLVGDGDFFRETFQRREIGAHHFDCFADLDQDGDLDLFQGGVEPFIRVLENTGANRYEDRGRLTSAGNVFTLPHNPHNHRSWVVPHFHDWDGDGDLDFFPSFMDGPYGGKIVFFENVTPKGGPLTFADRGALLADNGLPIAGGPQAGGWFPSIVFVKDFDHSGEGRFDLILGSNNHCYLYRNLGKDDENHWRWAKPETIQAGGEDIDLFNPSFEVADIDDDGDWDLFAAPQSGPILFYENIDPSSTKTRAIFAKGVSIAYEQGGLRRSTHPRMSIADFTGDGRLDFVVDRAWEVTNLDYLDTRDYGSLFRNMGTQGKPDWKRFGHDQGAPYTETFQTCDGVRQNVVRATDWDHDGRMDLLAGDCEGHVWLFHNQSDNLAPIFAPGEKLLADGKVLVIKEGDGHARPDVTDWNQDGLPDLVISDAVGRVFVHLNKGTLKAPRLAGAMPMMFRNEQGEISPIQRGTRSHILVCDWNNDGKQDLVMSDQENPGYYLFTNEGTAMEPMLGPAKRIPLERYVRPNLGSYVDWDGDGKKDFIGCEFEHSIRLYRNVGDGGKGAAPKFANRKGETLLRPWSIMMISGVDAVDWNGDGDLDLLTGQGHGGSGLRYYERDYLEDLKNNTQPRVRIVEVQTSKD